MRLTGNIFDIKNTRDSKLQDIALQVDKIQFITYKKDGRFFQPFEFAVDLEAPLIITGDCLARTSRKPANEGEYAFHVYDKSDEDYVLNPQKQLTLEMEYASDEDLHILSSVEYIVTVSNEDFNQLKADWAKQNKQNKGRKNR